MCYGCGNDYVIMGKNNHMHLYFLPVMKINVAITTAGRDAELQTTEA